MGEGKNNSCLVYILTSFTREDQNLPSDCFHPHINKFLIWIFFLLSFVCVCKHIALDFQIIAKTRASDNVLALFSDIRFGIGQEKFTHSLTG